MQEEKRSNSALFLTLTYSTKTVPLSSNTFMTLCKRDVQLFMKRLRKASEKDPGQLPIKYYICGEYGGKKGRPHYHALLFNADVNLVSAAWGNGEIYYGFVSGASVGYTLKYMCKPAWRPKHKNDDRAKPFSVMSKGIGKEYLTPRMIKYHLADLENRMHLTVDRDKKISMPRYYKDKIYSEDQRKAIAFFQVKKLSRKTERFLEQFKHLDNDTTETKQRKTRLHSDYEKRKAEAASNRFRHFYAQGAKNRDNKW